MTKYVKYIIVNMFIHTSLNGDITSRYAYVLGTIQMFVFGGGGLQLLMCLTFSAVAFFGRSELHAKGVFEALKPNDTSCVAMPALREQLRCRTCLSS